MFKIIKNDISEAVRKVKADEVTRTAVKVAIIVLTQKIEEKLNSTKSGPIVSKDVIEEIANDVLIDILEGRV